MGKTEQPIKLFVASAGWGVPFSSAAPFPLKLETWLRMTGLHYEIVVENDTRKGPTKKTPWIVDGDVTMGDSELIIAYLREKYGVDPDAGLQPQERAVALAWHRTFEEHYHQAFEHELFLGSGGAERIEEYLASLPAIVRPVAKAMFARALARQLYARGLARHSEETLIAMGKADLDAASVFLGDKEFFLGETPHTIDACVFGFLAVSIFVAGDNPLFRHAASLDNLVQYTERMRGRYFPETLSATPAMAVRTGSARSATRARSPLQEG